MIMKFNPDDSRSGQGSPTLRGAGDSRTGRHSSGLSVKILPPRRHTGFLSRMFGRHPKARIEGAWVPRVDMMEREGQLVIHAELPGMTRNQVKVEVTDDAVTLRGEHKEEKKDERKGYYYSECRH